MCTRDYVEEAQKICLGFLDPDRKVRRQVYHKLICLLNETELTIEDLRNIFNATHVHFLNGLRDKSEAVREEAVKFLSHFIIEKLPLNDYYLSYVFPVFVERVGTVEVVEPSEEVRLRIVDCLNEIVKKYSDSNCLTPFYNQFVTILCETLKDRCPDVKKASCESIISIEKAIRPDFHLQAESFLKPALSCFMHQRFKVRLAGVKAVGVIVMHSSHKGVNEAIGPMGERLLDSNCQVRQAVVEVVGNWLLNHRDRYSYFGKMVPLLLTSLSDETRDIQTLAVGLWYAVGAQYLRENEKDLKERFDFCTKPPKHYPKKISRPELGCRVLVCKDLNGTLAVLANELTSWKEDIRFKCSQLLSTLVLHAEENITHHLQTVLTILFAAARDDDKRVVDNVILASKYIGIFVRYEIWSKQLIPILKDEPNYGHLNVLAGILSGSSTDDLKKAALPITTILVSDRVAYSRRERYQLSLLKCVKNFGHKFEPNDMREVYFNLYKIVTCLIALKQSDNVNITPELYDTLCLKDKDVQYNYSRDLYQEILDRDPRLWTANSDDACILMALMRYSGSLASNIEIVTEILKQIVNNDTDPMIKLNVFRELAEYFHNKDELLKMKEQDKDLPIVTKGLENIIKVVIGPALKWSAGATAEALRTLAVTCLAAILEPFGPAKDQVVVYNDKDTLAQAHSMVVTLLTSSLMEDASHLTRQTAIKCIMHLKFRSIRLNVVFTTYREVCAALLKRLDDPIDEVRIVALEALILELKVLPKSDLKPSMQEERQNMANVLLIHFDDDDEKISRLAEEALTNLLKFDNKLIKRVEEQMPALTHRKKCKLLIRDLRRQFSGDDDNFFFQLLESSDEDN